MATARSTESAVESVPRTDNQNPEVLSHRIRTPTEKGLSYSCQQLCEKLKRSWRHIEQKAVYILRLLDDSLDVPLVESKWQEVDKLLTEHEELSTTYKSLLADDDRNKYELECQGNECFIADFKTKLYTWFRLNRPKDCTGSAVSVRSRSTEKSSRRSTTASERAMRQAAKVAALEASVKFVAEEADVEYRQLKSAQQAKSLQLKKEMAVAQAELSVYKQYEAEESGECAVPPILSSVSQLGKVDTTIHTQQPSVKDTAVTFVDQGLPRTLSDTYGLSQATTTKVVGSSTTFYDVTAPSFNPRVPPPVVVPLPAPTPAFSFPSYSVPQLNVSSISGAMLQPNFVPPITLAPPVLSAPPVLPCVTSQYWSGMQPPLENDSERLAISLSDAFKQNNLPKLELPVFSGDHLEFQRWLVSFEKIIEDSTLDPVKRLHYLLQYTSGDANMLVSGYALNQSEEGYSAAKAELIKEFGNAYTVARAYLKRIESWKSIPVSDVAGLKAFSIFLKSCKGSMPSLKHLQQLNTDSYLQKIVAKLSVPLQSSWRKHIDSLEQSGKVVNFAELVDFVDREARIAKHPVFSFEALQNCESKAKATGDGRMQSTAKSKARAVLATSMATAESVNSAATTDVTQQASKYSCPKCTKAHDLDACGNYLRLPVEERRKFLISKHLCFGCYGRTSKNHDVRSCHRRRKCGECGKLHPTGLHWYRPVKPVQTDSTSTTATEDETAVKLVACTTDTQPGSIAMSIVLVRVYHESDPSNEVVTYAALDSMSSASFVSDDTCRQLGVRGETTKITVKTMNDEQHRTTEVITGLRVSAVNGNESVNLPKVYTQESIPVGTDEIPSVEIIKGWSHISHLVSQIEPRNSDLQVGLLIGANCPKALEPCEVIPSVDSGPFAVKTLLGWSISGPTGINYNGRCYHSECSVVCHRAQVHESTKVTDIGLKDLLMQMHDHDFIETKSYSPALSQNDRKFLDLMESEVKMIDGHYQLPLPFMQQDVPLPDNREQVLKRAEGLKKRFKADKKFHSDYKKFMEDLICKGYAERIPDSDYHKVEGVWFVPHHGVYHPQKPDKVRVVFDCSCQQNGASLNRTLLQGPDLTNSLFGVLCRFRQEPIAIIADIESMFYQVQVPEVQRDYLRFFWWPDGDIMSELQEFRMTVHLFGAVSSPSCANFALRRTATDNETKFGTSAADTLRRNFYVDDMLKAAETTEAAIKQIADVRQMCSAGGFKLTKFLSNSREVLETIPMPDRAKNIVNVNLSQCLLPVERTLGVLWCIENDTIGFRIVLRDKPLTRRGVLSSISSVYDPLGLAAPFLLKGKKLLQTLCQSKLEWDDLLDDEYRAEWEQWRSYLPLLEEIQVPRCFKPDNFGQLVDVQLHHFSDASLYGYGQCSYVRLVDTAGHIHCSLILGKSRVSPLKQITVPRLELTAATVSAKVSHMLQQELDYQQATHIFWTDSKAVLGYICNDARRFHTFVANRVQLIRDLSDVNHWHYVETDTNPADDASRGLDCHNISSSHRWFHGPSFLWKPEDQWQSNSVLAERMSNYDVDSDPEVKKAVIVCTTRPSANDDVMNRVLEYHSSWYKLKKAIAWIVVVKTQLIQKVKQLSLRDMTYGLSVTELQVAETAILKYVQQQAFGEEISAMRTKQAIKKQSKLCHLSPVWNASGLLCIGGRLRNSSLPIQSQFPVILPSKHHATALLIRHCHEQHGHVGKEFVLSLLRERYWIIGARQAVRQMLKNCITCRKIYSQPVVQKMADLPVDRVTPDKPPFTFVGLDFFGPFLVKVGRSMVKRYGCIFTCLAVRAVHIEVAHSLEADSFINALHRFIARRGQPRELRSDNGSNFVAGERELRESVQSWNNSRTQEFLRQKEIRWTFNPPSASHMGGIWERQIRTVRRIMSALINQQQLTDEALQTLLCIVEGIINSRPLTAVSDDPTDIEPLTPNHLLQLRSGPTLPPGDFEKRDIYCRRRWRQIQYLADVFWRRWTKEYLQRLQLRSKWLHEQPNVKLNDIVLIADDNLPRNCWSMGRVVKLLPGSDGLVRAVEVKTRTGLYTRPIHKLCMLESTTDC